MARVFIYPRRSSVLYFGRWHSSTGLLPTKLGMMLCILSRPMNHESQNKKAALGNVTHCRRGRPPTPPPAAARRRRPPAPTNATYSPLPRQRRGTPTDASAPPPPSGSPRRRRRAGVASPPPRQRHDTPAAATSAAVTPHHCQPASTLTMPWHATPRLVRPPPTPRRKLHHQILTCTLSHCHVGIVQKNILQLLRESMCRDTTWGNHMNEFTR